MKRAEEPLASVTPKLVLDHYWKVFDHITWRDIKRPEKREYFTIEDIATYFSERLNENDFPVSQRLCFRSMVILEIVLNELVASGLLFKEDGIFRMSEEYSELHRLLKKMKTSIRRITAWAIWYLYHKGVVSFSTQELLSELSYNDEEYRDELRYLFVWRDEAWFKLLAMREDKWHIVEEPHRPTKPLLLLGIRDKLLRVIFELSETKKEFSEEEVVVKLREIETESLEATLKRSKLISKNGKWILDESSLSNIRRILSGAELSLSWPFYGILIVRSPFFKLLGSQSRTLYVDVPNSSIHNFVEQLERTCPPYKDDQDEMIKRARELAKDFNVTFKRELGAWLSFSIRKTAFMDRPFGVMVLIKWDELLPFLEEYSRRDLPLEEKYEYILNCRAPSLTLVMRGDMERTQVTVRKLVEEEIGQISSSLGDLTDFLNEVKDRLLKMARRRKTIPMEPSTLQYLPEMISTLHALISLVENGTIPACYREMRKILENLAWMIFDDYLFFKTRAIKSRKNYEIPRSPYAFISRQWYEWSVQNKFMIRHLGKLKETMKNLVDLIQAYGQEKEYKWDARTIEKAVFSNFSTSLYLFFVGKDLSTNNLEFFIPQYDTNVLIPLIKEDLKQIIKSLKRRSLPRSDKEFLEKVAELFAERVSRSVVAPYPSNEFVLGFVDKVFNSSLLKKYRGYSHFVHSYYSSWHIFPFSSVLEFKVFRHELEVFSEILYKLINNYVRELFT